MKARLTTLKAIGLLLHNTGEGRELPDLVFKSRHTVEMTHAGQPFPRRKLVCDDPSQQPHVARLRLLPAELMPQPRGVHYEVCVPHVHADNERLSFTTTFCTGQSNAIGHRRRTQSSGGPKYDIDGVR